MLSRFVGAVLLLAPVFVASSYDDRPMNEDDYFGARMQEHYQGQGLYQEPQAGRGRYALVLGALAGVGLEWFWTGRSIKKDRQQHIQLAQEFKTKWTLERDALVSRRTYPVKILSNELEDADLLLLQLVAAAEDAGVDVRMLNVPGLSGLLGSRAFRDTMEYEEFKLPDINNDDLITRQEYNQYIKGFLAMNPETPLSDIPRFEDFDVDRDGVVTFAEWQYYLDQNRSGQMDNELINELYDFGGQAQNYQRGQGGGGRRY